MGICSSKRNATADRSYCMDTVDESFTDESTAIDLKQIVDITLPGVYNKSPGAGISGIITNVKFPSVNNSKNLFLTESQTSSFKESQTSSFKRASTRYAVDLTEVTAQLFFGSFEDASNEKKLVELGITHIISLIGPKNKIKYIKHKHEPMNDYGRTELKKVITRLWPYIEESQEVGNKLFVHCQSGQNRSATLVLAILMKLKNQPNKLEELYTMVKKKRPIIQIHEKYAKQLCEMESELFGKTSVPKNWMVLCSYDIETGSVRFNDEIKKNYSQGEHHEV